MCNQAVSLVAAELERHGISTVSVVLLKEVAEKVRPPRALFVPYPHGYPLGVPGDAAAQKDVLEAALQMLEDPSLGPPALVSYARHSAQGKLSGS